MLNLDQCLRAYRPLTFVVAESDMEVMGYLRDRLKLSRVHVWSSTLVGLASLDELLDNKFVRERSKAQSELDILDNILTKNFNKKSAPHEFYVFLDCDGLVNDKQHIRKIKDILSRYQLDTEFSVSLIMISQTVCVPAELERLSEVAFFDLPDDKELKVLSDQISQKLKLPTDKVPSTEVINNLVGLTKFEVEQAYVQSYGIYREIKPSFILDFKKSAIAKTKLLSLLETNVTFDQIGGMDTLKAWIKKSYGGWTVKGKEYGLPLMKGLLLVGLPGCGKTLLCKALGNEWGLPVVVLDPSRLFSSRVGESEHNIRRVLQVIENMSPCILMIDEIEKGFAGSQSSTFSDSGVTARVIGTFLIWLVECTKPVFTVATSNQIQYLPPELISRFDETFFVNIPQLAERKDIFSIHLKKLNRDLTKIDLDALAVASQDLSGREIEQVLREALYDAFYTGKELSTDIIKEVLAKKTNLLTAMAEQLRYLKKWVGWDDSKKDGVRARFASPVDIEDMNRIKDQIDKLCNDVATEGPSLPPRS